MLGTAATPHFLRSLDGREIINGSELYVLLPARASMLSIHSRGNKVKIETRIQILVSLSQFLVNSNIVLCIVIIWFRKEPFHCKTYNMALYLCPLKIYLATTTTPVFESV